MVAPPGDKDIGNKINVIIAKLDQEKDLATRALTRINMVVHGVPHDGKLSENPLS
jgi:hypothetical protein